MSSMAAIRSGLPSPVLEELRLLRKGAKPSLKEAEFALSLAGRCETIDEAVEFASKWTPRGWMPEDSNTAWGEQHFYLTQPGYATSYLVGKHQVEELMAERALQLGDDFTLKGFIDEIHAAGVIPMSLIRWELTGEADEILQTAAAH